MDIVNSRCPFCGEEISFNNNKAKIFCLECGKELITKNLVLISAPESKPVSKSHNLVEDYLELGQKAFEHDDGTSCLTYGEKILDVEPKNPMGWLLKGTGQVLNATIGNPMVNEFIMASNNAFEYSRDPLFKESVVKNWLQQVNKMLSYTHLEFKNSRGFGITASVKKDLFKNIHYTYILHTLNLRQGISSEMMQLKPEFQETGNSLLKTIYELVDGMMIVNPSRAELINGFKKGLIQPPEQPQTIRSQILDPNSKALTEEFPRVEYQCYSKGSLDFTKTLLQKEEIAVFIFGGTGVTWFAATVYGIITNKGNIYFGSKGLINSKKISTNFKELTWVNNGYSIDFMSSNQKNTISYGLTSESTKTLQIIDTLEKCKQKYSG
jgi:hypothetical protein